jgi:hypothetical protein
MRSCIAFAIAGVEFASCSPVITSVGQLMRDSSSMASDSAKTRYAAA